MIDCTCPFVKKVQSIANEYAKQDYTILIMGNKEHPEVKGILGWALNKGIAFQTLEELQELNLSEQKICLVAQTTENVDKFDQAVKYLENNHSNLLVFNTICSATLERQKSASELAKNVDLMLVIGGLNSANTQKLVDLCLKAGVQAKHIEQANEIKKSWFNGINVVGVRQCITPDWIIEEVVRTMEEMKNNVEDQATEKTVEETTETQEQLEKGMTNFGEVKPGDIITGKVVQINNEEVLVDVGGKSEGIIPVNELSYRKVEDPNVFVKVGEDIKVLVLKVENSEGNMVLSKRRADQEEALVKLEKAFEENSVIEAEVIEVVKGGVLVDVGMRGFVPASLIERGYVENLEQFIGKKLQFKVIGLIVKLVKRIVENSFG